MILHRSALSSRRYRSDESDPVAVEIRWSRSLGGFRRDGEMTVGEESFELRTEGFEVWLMDGEDSRAYAKGAATRWEVDLDGRALLLTQPSFGKSISDLTEGDRTIGQLRAADRLLRKVLVNVADDVSPQHQAFLAAIAIRGWRETLAGVNDAAAADR